MKKQKWQFLILVAVCILCGIGYFLIRRQDFDQETQTQETQVIDFSAEEVTELRVEGDVALDFVKQDGVWTETSLPGEKIDQDSVNSLVSRISSITTTQSVLESPEDLAAYGLEEPPRIVSATLTNGSDVTIRMGEKSELLMEYYIQVEGDPNVYLVAPNIVTGFDRAPEDFIEEETQSETESTAETESAAETE